ncbi:MAG: DMT family transporter [Rhodospirillales bacterium]|nr:DMT family transporter [Rhodospirillales bacterium]
MSNNSSPSADNNLHGILLMLAGVFVLAIMDVIAKLLVEADYSPFQILAFRGWIISSCLIGWIAFRGQLRALKTTRSRDHVLRAGIGFCMPYLFFTALGTMPIADAVVIFFMAPVIMTILSIPLLKEIVGTQRWAAIAVGFIGVIIVIQPSGGAFQVGTIYALGACVAYSLLGIMDRWMGETEPPIRLVFYFSLGNAVIGTCALPFVWKPMPMMDVLIILGMAAVAMFAHILITSAYIKAPISVIAPFEYSALIWSTMFGLLIWSDFPARHVWFGAAIIVISGIYMVHREHVNNKNITKEAREI